MQDGLEGKPEVLIDPNTYFEDENVSFSSYICTFSEDGKYMIYGTTICGSDFITLKVMRIEDRTTLPDTISWVSYFSCFSTLIIINQEQTLSLPY